MGSKQLSQVIRQKDPFPVVWPNVGPERHPGSYCWWCRLRTLSRIRYPSRERLGRIACPRRLAVVEPTDPWIVANREVAGFKERPTEIPVAVLRVADLLAFAITEVLATDGPTIGDSMDSRGEMPPVSASRFTDTKTMAA